MDDDEYFEKALAEYRGETGDSRESADLPSDVLHLIVHRAQQLKQRTEQEKRG